MRAIDTNLLVRLLARDNPKQVAVAEAFIAPGAWVSHLVLAESLWVLASVYAATNAHIAASVAMLLDHEHLVIQDADVVTAALEQLRKRPTLGFSDCLIVEVARKAGHLPLGTFDRGLGKIDGAKAL